MASMMFYRRPTYKVALSRSLMSVHIVETSTGRCLLVHASKTRSSETKIANPKQATYCFPVPNWRMRRFMLCLLGCLWGLVVSAQPKLVESGGGRMWLSSARQRDSIEAKFPYDIALLRPDSVYVRSDSVLVTSKREPVVLLFWLNSCGPCRAEMDVIKRSYADWQSQVGFKLVAINEEYPHRFGMYRERVAAEQWPWQTFNDVNHEFGLILPGGLNGLPQVFVLDAKGDIVYQSRKFVVGDELLLLDAIKRAASR